MSEDDYAEELRNVCHNYPVFAGDTISHEGARVCSDRGWIVRDADGNWIPTKEGLLVLRKEPF